MLRGIEFTQDLKWVLVYQAQDPKHVPLEMMFRDDITLILQTPLLAGQLNQHNITGVLEAEIIILEIHLTVVLEATTILDLDHLALQQDLITHPGPPNIGSSSSSSSSSSVRSGGRGSR